jgi:hypothetical protein
MIPIGRFQGGKHVLIDADRQKSIWDMIVILNTEPNWLNPRAVDRHTKEPSALLSAENGSGDSNWAVVLCSVLWKRIKIAAD